MTMTPEHESDGRWLRRLRDLAQDWLVRTSGLTGHTEEGHGKRKKRIPVSIAMDGYADLLFAFGLARLGEVAAARELLHCAKEKLPATEEIHRVLWESFAYRTGQALEGKPHAGLLPDKLLDTLKHMSDGRSGHEGRIRLYAIDRLREYSRILEPDQKINPYRYWSGRTDDGFFRALAEVTDLRDPIEVATQLNALLQRVNELTSQATSRFRRLAEKETVVQTALDLAPRLGKEFVYNLLERVRGDQDLFEVSPDKRSSERFFLLTSALELAIRFRCRDSILGLVDLFRTWPVALATRISDPPAVLCIRGLRLIGLSRESSSLSDELIERILGRNTLQSLDPSSQPASARALLGVAGEWYLLGRNKEADALIAQSQPLLFRGDIREKMAEVLCAYAVATTRNPDVIKVRESLEALFANLKRVYDTFSTMRYFNLTCLKFLETIVLAAVDVRDTVAPVIVHER
jgi:hypothetical protein